MGVWATYQAAQPACGLAATPIHPHYHPTLMPPTHPCGCQLLLLPLDKICQRCVPLCQRPRLAPSRRQRCSKALLLPLLLR